MNFIINKSKVITFLKGHLYKVIFLGLAVGFSWWLMWSTFDYQNGTIYIASRAWSDFSANVPLIRSFSWGVNYPPEYPLFPGEPIRYHFIFYWLVGMLEKIGLNLGWALNTLSILGFLGLIIAAYSLAKLITKQRSVAFLSVVFLLFNGSFSFIEFIKTHPLSMSILSEITNSRNFSSFGPYDGKIVSAFWNLNIYTNQRHLAAGYFLVIIVVFFLLREVLENKFLKRWQILFLSLSIGLTPYFHKVVFLIVWVFLTMFFLSFPKIRRTIILLLIISSAIAFPQIFFQFGNGTGSFSIHTGYLIPSPISLLGFLTYWIHNLGLVVFLAPVGAFLLGKLGLKILIAAFSLFVIGNTFQFSPEIAANHKFFNLFVIFANFFGALTIYRVWKQGIVGKLLAPILVFFMVFSGIIDFFPIRNDYRLAIDDSPKNPDIAWIKNNTPPSSLFLNSSFLYHPASLAGRKIFYGWPYFGWSAGYGTNERGIIFKTIYETRDRNKFCTMLRNNKIDYFTIENTRGDINLPNIDVGYFEKNYFSSYQNRGNGFFIYSVRDNCG